MLHSVGCLFLYGALDSHPFSPSRAALGRCFLSAAGVGAGVVSALTEPSGWCGGAVLDVAGCVICASVAPSSWRIGVVLVVAGVPPPPGIGHGLHQKPWPGPPPRHGTCVRGLHGGASNGQVAVSAFGSGCACPTAVIAICPRVARGGGGRGAPDTKGTRTSSAAAGG